MTFSSWPDVPAGTPVHHHCVATVETKYDPKHWADASQMEPHHVAWQPWDAMVWMQQQLVRACGEATGDRERGEIEQRLTEYETAEFEPVVDAWAPFWDRHASTVQSGSWILLPVWMGSGRKLVVQMVSYGDTGTSGVSHRGDRYTVCTRHRRPDDLPYVGLNDRQHEVAARYNPSLT